ncbi:hypothetical protein H5410_051260 [Solanum commersonii]|uniref:Uncharacterized protein n=1 Tax=Solanum commersonii TaxID=4109 RepID=A0A9J5WXP9_SOLCO|nr:hypothetical protein H5410_051260 [Solanum commersonii]
MRAKSISTPATNAATMTALSHGLRPLRNRAPESGSIGSIELPHNLLAIRPWVSSHPVTLVKAECTGECPERLVQAPVRTLSPYVISWAIFCFSLTIFASR